MSRKKCSYAAKPDISQILMLFEPSKHSAKIQLSKVFMLIVGIF